MGSADGVHYLLEAARHIVHTLGRRDVQFLLMGSGPEHEDLLRRRNEAGLESYVDMPGRVTNEFLFTALQTMDLGVACDPINAYNDHCTMNKTLEYMAFGKPQVMFGTKEGMHSAGDAALCVMENSAEKLGEAILELLDDPESRQRMGNAGRQRLTNELNWERSVQQLLAGYQRAMQTS
jgi:glycosyltransferase involved in cell wall biosynthesis